MMAIPKTPAPTKAEPASCRGEAALEEVAFEAEAEAAEEAELTAAEAELRADEAAPVALLMAELTAPESVAEAKSSL